MTGHDWRTFAWISFVLDFFFGIFGDLVRPVWQHRRFSFVLKLGIELAEFGVGKAMVFGFGAAEMIQAIHCMKLSKGPD